MSVNGTLTDDPLNTYDYNGAAIYIAITLIWYSTGLALMLFLQVRPHTFQNPFTVDEHTTDKSRSSTANPFGHYGDIEADHATKQILNELKDPERRDRLWKIYFASTEKQIEPHSQYYQTITADSATIGRINQKLATIHRMQRRGSRPVSPLPTGSATSTDNRFDTVKFLSKRLIPARRLTQPAIIDRPLPRVRSEPDTPSVAAAQEAELLIFDKPAAAAPLTNGSRKRNPKFLTRFTIERVSESDGN